MIFNTQKYCIPDEPHRPFIDPAEIEGILFDHAAPSAQQVRAVIERALAKNRLSLAETAILLNANTLETRKLILDSARRLKREVYGNRIVLFAPLYISNRCVNRCTYCGFRAENGEAVRRALSDAEIIADTQALEDAGHKRLILVYGEHPSCGAEKIADDVRLVYNTVKGRGEIRRVNINAAPLDVDGFRKVHAAGIGTYQIFQETYHPEAYRKAHPGGPKSIYNQRLTAFDRAMEAGIDDVGIGALLGLYDWRFEVMAMVRHANHLEACFGVGPHTISFPRIKKASGTTFQADYLVDDEEFTLLVAILRLAVPYTGLILTAREPAALRERLIDYGVTQIDGGTRLEIGGYSADNQPQNLHREQFELGDGRTLSEVIRSLVDRGRIPSFCTACYRRGRTGEHFMEFSTRGFIKRFCTPNALLTFAEYLEDYADADARTAGWTLIINELEKEPHPILRERLEKVKRGERDLLF